MKIMNITDKKRNPNPSQLTVVMISGACCIPGMAAFDSQAQCIIEQAISETGINAQLKIIPATTAMYGGVSRKITGELMAMFNTGKVGVPAILINGQVISYGVPKLEDMKDALNKLTAEKANMKGSKKR